MTHPTRSCNRALRILTSAALVLICGALTISTAAAASIDNPVIYTDDQTAASTIQDRDPGYKPLYLVYADKQRTAEEAKKLVVGINEVERLVARVAILNRRGGR